MVDPLEYHCGFNNEFESEALPNAVPKDQNNPRVCPYGLYAEQVSGSAFTVPRCEQKRTWLYRIRPSVTHEPFQPLNFPTENLTADFSQGLITPNQLRWRPAPVPIEPVDFVRGLITMCGAGRAAMKEGFAIHLYTCNESMTNSCLANADGHLLIVPQQGVLYITTELGRMVLSPGEVACIPRGLRFSVALEPPPAWSSSPAAGSSAASSGSGGASSSAPAASPGGANGHHVPGGSGAASGSATPPANGTSTSSNSGGGDGGARGYVLEVFQGFFTLPDLGPIGANGLASPRHFLTPVAAYEEDEGPVEWHVMQKLEGQLFSARQDFSPFNVVAWHGNYVPFKYDLSKFCPVNAVSFDHPDPSIFTVLTVPSAIKGVAVVDFVVFPPRWTVAEHTFRPPYYHRNVMNEFMGLIKGEYEAKKDGFLPGGASLHLCMTPHGPDTATFEGAVSAQAENPARIAHSALAFMFETSATPRITPAALGSPYVDRNYYKCWMGLRSHFDKSWTPEGASASKPTPAGGASSASAVHALKEQLGAAKLLSAAASAGQEAGQADGASAAPPAGKGHMLAPAGATA